MKKGSEMKTQISIDQDEPHHPAKTIEGRGEGQGFNEFYIENIKTVQQSGSSTVINNHSGQNVGSKRCHSWNNNVLPKKIRKTKNNPPLSDITNVTVLESSPFSQNDGIRGENSSDPNLSQSVNKCGSLKRKRASKQAFSQSGMSNVTVLECTPLVEAATFESLTGVISAASFKQSAQGGSTQNTTNSSSRDMHMLESAGRNNSVVMPSHDNYQASTCDISKYISSKRSKTLASINEHHPMLNTAPNRLPNSARNGNNLSNRQKQFILESGEGSLVPMGYNDIATVARNLGKEFQRAALDYSETSEGDGSDHDQASQATYDCNRVPQYIDEGDPIHTCQFCGAMLWYNERLKSYSGSDRPKFSICCLQGKIQVPFFKTPPPLLRNLFFNKGTNQSKKFLTDIRAYNNMFSFTSMGGKIDHSVNAKGKGPYTFVLGGQNYHYLGSLLPTDGQKPIYSQLYIHDTENEIQNRIAAVSGHTNGQQLDGEIVEQIKNCLDACNTLVKKYRMVSYLLKHDKQVNVKLRLIRNVESNARPYDMPTSSEIAALIVGDFDSTHYRRDIIVEKQSGSKKRVDELHCAYLPLQYPLIFHYGNNGYVSDSKHNESTLDTTLKKTRLTLREYIAFRLMDRNFEESVLLHSKRLLQQFIVDAYCMVESDRLQYYKTHQKELRVDLYRGLSDAHERGETDPSTLGKRIILPSSFTGGARYLSENYKDAMAICAWAGYPDIFLTFTCNPAWPEIKRFCKEKGLDPSDRPDILTRMFNLKLDALMKTLKDEQIFGKIKAEIYTIEFQKRGLPHVHIILFLEESCKIKTPDDVDKFISAELPDENIDKELYELVGAYMMHGPCGGFDKNAPCMKDDKCKKYFPKKFVERTVLDEQGYPTYRRRNDGRTYNKKGILLDNRYVVPHNPKLLKLFHGHLNVEKTNQSNAVKYLFKYVNKGNDRVIAAVCRSSDPSNEDRRYDEITQYLNCRYISPCEGSWRVFAFPIYHRYPPVVRLSFHLPDQQSIVYSTNQKMSTLVNKPRVKESMFIAWMLKNKDKGKAETLRYSEFPLHYTYDKKEREWKLRKRGFCVGRLAHASPSQGELYFLRILLTKVTGPTSYEDIRTVGNVIHPTFRDACYARGLLDDDQEFIDGIKEASAWATGKYLRKFFVSMLLSHCLSQPRTVWDKTKSLLSEDMLYIPRHDITLSEISIPDSAKENECLHEIEKLLLMNGKSLADYPSMPMPTGDCSIDAGNQLILHELNYNRDECASQSMEWIGLLTDEQSNIFHQIMSAVTSGSGGFFFVYGFGGTGKTFLWNVLTSSLRARGEIVLNVASSGIAATLLPSGRTAHSRFAIPIDINEDSTCNIYNNSPLARLLQCAKLIIWDEAPMIRRLCVEAFDRTMRDIMRCDLPFGGKCMVLGGDFRQILPVIPRGDRADIVDAAINSSYLWHDCKVFTLTKNMRLRSSNDAEQQRRIKDFSEWLLRVGEGKVGNPKDGIADIEIPESVLIKDCVDPLHSIVTSTYPNLIANLFDSGYLTNRAILAPTMEVVDQINDYMLSLVPGDSVDYYSSDSICKTDSNGHALGGLYDTEFLNTIKCSGMPHHRLVLKVGVPIMLIRNIDQASGLCNGTRLRTTVLGKHCIKAIALNGNSVGQEVLIHRMDMNPSDSKMPFKMNRRQFPVIISFAMTINKSQGQSMTNVGLFLPNPVFSHGQLYVAISRVKSIDGLKVLILDKDKKPTNVTTNVVYVEAFQNVQQN